MAVVHPTFDSFIYWYGKCKRGECTKSYARQMVGFKEKRWYYLCRDYESGLDVSKYFEEEDS